MTLSKKQKIGLSALIIVGLILIGYFGIRYGLFSRAVSLVNENTPVPLFIVLMIILPIFGVPVSPFLVVLGIKFGLAAGIALMVIIMPIHMMISFALAKVAGNFIRAVLSRKNYVIPQVPPDRQIRFSFLVTAVPLLPYAVKNFLLPLAGIPFRLYLGMNWGCQAILASPAVVLGSSMADLNPVMFIVAIAGLVIVYLVVSRIETKYGKHVDLKTEKNESIASS